jgi:hypothetical protein
VLVKIAVSTGIPISDLVEWSLADIETALTLLRERNGHYG